VERNLDREFERERWRGVIERRTMEHEEELRKFWDWKDDIEGRVAAAVKKIEVIDTKAKVGIAIFAAGGSVAGGIIVALVQHALK